MKKYLFILAIAMTNAVLSTAQELDLDRKFIAGGSASYSRQVIDNPNDNTYTIPFNINDFSIQENVKEYSFHSLQLTLYAGMHISANGVIGILGRYSFLDSKNTPQNIASINIGNAKSDFFGAGFFYRHYFKMNSNLNLYAQPNIFASKNNKESNIMSVFNEDRISQTLRSTLSLNVGMQYALNDKWNVLINLSLLNFSTQNTTYDTESTIEKGGDLLFSANLRDINIGVEYKF